MIWSHLDMVNRGYEKYIKSAISDSNEYKRKYGRNFWESSYWKGGTPTIEEIAFFTAAYSD